MCTESSLDYAPSTVVQLTATTSPPCHRSVCRFSACCTDNVIALMLMLTRPVPRGKCTQHPYSAKWTQTSNMFSEGRGAHVLGGVNALGVHLTVRSLHLQSFSYFIVLAQLYFDYTPHHVVHVRVKAIRLASETSMPSRQMGGLCSGCVSATSLPVLSTVNALHCDSITMI